MGDPQFLQMVDPRPHATVAGTGLDHTGELAMFGGIDARGGVDGEVAHMHLIDDGIFTFLKAGRTAHPSGSSVRLVSMTMLKLRWA